MNAPARPTTAIRYANFKPFYVRWWNASASTLYRVHGYSISGASAYIERDGLTQLVPVSILDFIWVTR